MGGICPPLSAKSPRKAYAQYRLRQEARPHHGQAHRHRHVTQDPRAAAKAALKAAEPEIMRGVSKGVLHKNSGARKVSRLAKRVAKLQK